MPWNAVACAATACLHTPRKACAPAKSALRLSEEGALRQSTCRAAAEVVWQLHLACMLGQQLDGLAKATRTLQRACSIHRQEGRSNDRR